MDPKEMNEIQKQALEQFKVKCKDVIRSSHSDRYLLKWLKARDFVVKDAETMFRKSMEWRERIGADKMLDEWDAPEVLRKYYAGGSYGVDREGSPVWYDLPSCQDFKGLLYSAQKSDIIKYEAYNMEKINRLLEEHSQKMGRPCDRATVIFDMHKLNIKHLWAPGLSLFSEIMAMVEANYPENLKDLYIVHAPRLFPMVYNIVKPLLTEETKRKVHVLGGNWKEKVHAAIDPDQLPTFWGGNKTDDDGDPYCRSKICLGGEIPKSYYLKDKKLSSSEYLNSKTVDRGSVLEVRVEVTEPHSIIRYEFHTKSYDIGFGVLRMTDSSQKKVDDMDVLIPIEKVNSHLVPQDGLVECPNPGTYVVAFDNRFSWVHNKAVTYIIELIRPKNVEDINNHIEKKSAEAITEILECTSL